MAQGSVLESSATQATALTAAVAIDDVTPPVRARRVRPGAPAEGPSAAFLAGAGLALAEALVVVVRAPRVAAA